MLPVQLPCPHHYRHLRFPGVPTAGGQTTLLGGPIVPEAEVDGPTASPGGQITSEIEAGGPTTTPGSQTTYPHATPSLPSLPTFTVTRAVPTTSVVPHATPTTTPAPCTTPASTTLPAPPVALAS
jgi:hypothetical protein